MRKLVVFALGVALALGIASPASAAKPTRTKVASASANAFWYSFKQLSRNTYENTVWYVGIYASSDGTFSDLYRETATCRVSRRGDSCTYSFAIGYSDLSGDIFTIDGEGLTSAHLQATYLLETYDEFGNPIGDAVPTTIVADWEGIGDLQQNGGRSSYCDQFVCIRSTFEDAFRSAEATGSVDGTDLGETYDAYLAASSYTSVERLK